MTPTDVRRARQRLALSQPELAAELGVSSKDVQDWELGTRRIPRVSAQELAWRLAYAEQQEALATSGLPECTWVQAWDDRVANLEPNKHPEEFEALNGHVDTCSVCQARICYAEEHLPPLPSRPMPVLMRIFSAVASIVLRLPSWSRPAAIGAAALFGIVLVRLLFRLPFFFRQPIDGREGLIALGAATAAGAAGGTVFSLTRPIFRRLGVAGDFLTAIACVTGYMFSLALASPYAFGEPLITQPSDWIIFGVLSIFFGLVAGFGWHRAQRDTASRGRFSG